jgi:Fe-coproporphyrin III synthase
LPSAYIFWLHYWGFGFILLSAAHVKNKGLRRISKMKNKIDYLLYCAWYFTATKVFGQDIPFIGGLVINDRCNLKCRQCRVGDIHGRNLLYSEVSSGLDAFYKLGIRSLFIEGGEPFLWEDRSRQLEDIVELARKTGFKIVTIYTNGTLPIETGADVVFVSLDGLRDSNNFLRGNVFDKVISTIENSSHPNININFTINRVNAADIEPFCEYVRQIRNIKGVFFYFHTPYYGIDDLFLCLEEKRRIIDRILSLKKRGFKILNSESCLTMVSKDNWARPSRLCYVYDKNRLFQCCRAIGNDLVCKHCGYLGYPEIISMLKLHPSSILAAMNYLPRNKI